MPNFLTVETILQTMEAYDYNNLFANILFKKKDWTAEDLLALKLPFFLHTGEYEQLARAIQFWNENFTAEERNAKIYEYLSLQNNRFAERLSLQIDIFSFEKFHDFYIQNKTSKWANREHWYDSKLKELFPDYKLIKDFENITLAGSDTVQTYAAYKVAN